MEPFYLLLIIGGENCDKQMKKEKKAGKVTTTTKTTTTTTIKAGNQHKKPKEALGFGGTLRIVARICVPSKATLVCHFFSLDILLSSNPSHGIP